MIVTEEIIEALGISRPAMDELVGIIGRMPTEEELSTLLAMWESNGKQQSLFSWLKGQRHAFERIEYLYDGDDTLHSGIREPKIKECVEIAKSLRLSRNENLGFWQEIEHCQISGDCEEMGTCQEVNLSHISGSHPEVTLGHNSSNCPTKDVENTVSPYSVREIVSPQQALLLYMVGKVSSEFLDSEYARRCLHLTSHPQTFSSHEEEQAYMEMILGALEGKGVICGCGPVGSGGLFESLIRLTQMLSKVSRDSSSAKTRQESANFNPESANSEPDSATSATSTAKFDQNPPTSRQVSANSDSPTANFDQNPPSFRQVSAKSDALTANFDHNPPTSRQVSAKSDALTANFDQDPPTSRQVSAKSDALTANFNQNPPTSRQVSANSEPDSATSATSTATSPQRSTSRDYGFDILSCREVRLDAFLFGEEPGRFLVAIEEPQDDFFLQKLDDARVDACFLGRTTKGRILVDGFDFGPVSDF